MHNGVKICMKSNPNIYDPTEKIREIYLPYCILQQFDKFLIWRPWYNRKRKLCESAGTCLEKLKA